MSAPTEDPAILLMNVIYQGVNNYQFRSQRRAHEDLTLLISRRAWRDLLASKTMVGLVDALKYKLMEFDVMLSENVADNEVRFVLDPDHALLRDIPRTARSQ